jgi:hypothetical protein
MLRKDEPFYPNDGLISIMSREEEFQPDPAGQEDIERTANKVRKFLEGISEVRFLYSTNLSGSDPSFNSTRTQTRIYSIHGESLDNSGNHFLVKRNHATNCGPYPREEEMGVIFEDDNRIIVPLLKGLPKLDVLYRGLDIPRDIPTLQLFSKTIELEMPLRRPKVSWEIVLFQRRIYYETAEGYEKKLYDEIREKTGLLNRHNVGYDVTEEIKNII